MRQFETFIKIAGADYKIIAKLLFETEREPADGFRKFIRFYLDKCETLLTDLEADLESAYRNTLYKRLNQNVESADKAVLPHNNNAASG